MGLIKNILERAKERNRKFKEAEDDERVILGLGERKKSHNERELLKILEKEKQRWIGEALFWEEKKRQLDDRKRARDMMKFNQDLFSGNDNLLSWGEN